ncbi:MAG: peptidylprolyl isomerase, partial [Solirubrobacterales bacterium]
VNLPGPKMKRPTASEVVFETTCGEFTVSLSEDSPKTAASFQYLAEEGVFDDTQFHRVVPGFVIQGGDPAGDGTGGPGFSVDEKPPGDTSYTKGVVAMAKTGAEPPGRSGSQFFVVTGADAGLPPDFAVAGEVSEGIEVVEAIEALGVPGSEAPSRPAVIESATAK